MGKNAKIIIFSLIGLAVLGGVAALLIFTAPQKEPPFIIAAFPPSCSIVEFVT